MAVYDFYKRTNLPLNITEQQQWGDCETSARLFESTTPNSTHLNRCCSRWCYGASIFQTNKQNRKMQQLAESHRCRADCTRTHREHVSACVNNRRPVPAGPVSSSLCTHLGSPPGDAPHFVGTWSQLVEAQGRGQRLEAVVLEQAPSLQAAGPQRLVVLVQVFHRAVVGADAACALSHVLQLARDARHVLRGACRDHPPVCLRLCPGRTCPHTGPLRTLTPRSASVRLDGTVAMWLAELLATFLYLKAALFHIEFDKRDFVWTVPLSHPPPLLNTTVLVTARIISWKQLKAVKTLSHRLNKYLIFGYDLW